MKSILKLSLVIAAFSLSSYITAQQYSFGQIQNRISRSQDGINVFDVKKDSVEFKGISVDLGGAFALQFQALDQFNDQSAVHPAPLAAGSRPITKYRLNNLENNINLPCANMTFGAQLADGVRVNLELYLAARHHNETWVKGGYLQIDKLDFISEGFLGNFMKYATVKIGQMENNYGDAHFRRSDNGNALMNPFIENNIMDSFITEPGIELYYNRSGFVSMIGVTNSKLNQSVEEIKTAYVGQNTVVSPTILAKLGYDKQLNDDLRVRLTASLYHVSNMSSSLYSSDRAGSRFYGVMTHDQYQTGVEVDSNGDPVLDSKGKEIPVVQANNFDPKGNFATGRFNPAFGNWATSVMFNPFIKYKGLELFGTVEIASGGDLKDTYRNGAIVVKGTDDKRSFTQISGDVVYRFGTKENLFVGTKYNTVSGKLANADAKEISINRLEASLGWFMTKNVLAKLAYINQEYKDFSQYNRGIPNDFYGGKFNGLMFESVISF